MWELGLGPLQRVVRLRWCESSSSWTLSMSSPSFAEKPVATEEMILLRHLVRSVSFPQRVERSRGSHHLAADNLAPSKKMVNIQWVRK